jgi:hypothetical protein
MTKWQNRPLTSQLLSPLPSRKTSSKTAYVAYIKKALVESLVVFKPKRPRLLFQVWFPSWVNSPSPHCHLCPRVLGGERHQYNLSHTLFTGYLPSELISLSKSEATAGWPLTVPGQLQDKLGRGHADYRQRWVHHGLLAILWALLQVHSDRQWLSWEKLGNKHLSNYNHSLFIEIFKFDFYSTSYMYMNIKMCERKHDHVSSFRWPVRNS